MESNAEAVRSATRVTAFYLTAAALAVAPILAILADRAIK